MNVEKEITNLKTAINQHAQIINSLADKIDLIEGIISKKIPLKNPNQKPREQYFQKDSAGNLIPLVEDDTAEIE